MLLIPTLTRYVSKRRKPLVRPLERYLLHRSKLNYAEEAKALYPLIAGLLEPGVLLP